MSDVAVKDRTAAGTGGQRKEATSGAELTLPVEGMTCAACANRIEKGLKRMDGVMEAAVNPATNRARVAASATAGARRPGAAVRNRPPRSARRSGGSGASRRTPSARSRG